MACEFFDEGRLARCTAVCGLLIPSHHEREKYCRTDESAACPTYQLCKLAGHPIPQEQYYGLWVPPAPANAADDTPPEPRAASV
jgi:hypothetical protein